MSFSTVVGSCARTPLWDNRVASRGATDSGTEVEQVVALLIGERFVPEGPICGIIAHLP